MEAVRLRIADKYFFDNAELLLPSIKDAAGGLLEDGVNAWLTQIYNLTPKTHKDRGVARSAARRACASLRPTSASPPPCRP